MALPDHRTQPVAASNHKALPVQDLPKHEVWPAAPSGKGAHPEASPNQEWLQSPACSPAQLQSPASGTSLPGNTAYDFA